jgi:RND family efflux transporter MFP subunit
LLSPKGFEAIMRHKGMLALLGLATAGLVGCGSEAPKLRPPEPPKVEFVRPVTDYVTDYEDFTGQTMALRTVNVRARVSGYLDKVNFKDGIEVNEGDLLFVIDPRPYEKEVQRTEAALKQAEAHLNRLNADYRRASELFARNVMSRQDFDLVSGDRAEAEAAVGVAKANLETARLNLSFTKVKADLAGRLSRRMVDPGNLVTADQTQLTSIVALDPMYVWFDIDERTLLRLRRLVREGAIKTREERAVPVFAALADEKGFPHKGTIDFSDNQLNPSTGTLSVRGVIENPKPRVLSPGLFVRIRIQISDPKKALLIPEQALVTSQGRKIVFIVNANNEVREQVVEVDKPQGVYRVITRGIGARDRIVVTGQQRIRTGMKVRPAAAAPQALATAADDRDKDKEKDKADTKGQAPAKSAEAAADKAPAGRSGSAGL